MIMDPDLGTDVPMLQSDTTCKTSRGRLKQYLATVSVSLGAVCAGTCLAWTSPALAQLTVNNSTNRSETFYLNHQESAAIGATIAIGALITAIPVGYLTQRFGPKKIILCLSITFLLNWMLIIFAQNSLTIIIARVFAGIGTGAICVTGPIYIGEIAEPALRGTLGAFLNMFLCLGILITCVFGAFTTWRILSIILAIIPILFAGSFVFMPESPWYLIKVDKVDKAEEVLRKTRADFCDINEELKQIQKEISESKHEDGKFTDLFVISGNRRALFAVVGVLGFQQLCGVNAVVFYTVPIFQTAGIKGISPDLAGIIIAVVQVVSSYLSILIIEKANRKFYLMLSSVGMMIFMLSLGMFFHLKVVGVDFLEHLNFLPVASAIFFMVFFSVGYGPIPWMLMGELFAPEVKGMGNGCAILTNWFCAFLVTFLFPIINAEIGAFVSFYLCAGFMAVATLFVYFIVPETRGKSLLEIQEILNR